MFTDKLKNAGLTDVQADIYNFLLTKKEAKASAIARETGRPRGVAYKGLDELVEMGLASKWNEPNMVSLFRAEHPSRLESVVERQERKIKQIKDDFGSLLPELNSRYNLTYNKPGVRFYEGRDGIETVAKDSLTSKTEILSYLDTESLMKNIKDFAGLYTKERIKKGITKKILEPENEYIIKFLEENEPKLDENALTQTKLLKQGNFVLNTVMQIYDNKISYINYAGKHIISFIIDDPGVYELHKQIFYSNWKEAKTIRRPNATRSAYA